MEIERPFRIKLPSHKEPEKSKETSLAKQPQKPLSKQFSDDFSDLQRRGDYAKAQNLSPSHFERHCKEFETQWAKKLEDAKVGHLRQSMTEAVDALRSGDTPDTGFTKEMAQPRPGPTKDATRRLARHTQQGLDDGHEMD